MPVTTDTIGWGLIGASNIARQRVAGAIRSSVQGRLVAVASHNLELAQAFAREFEIPSAYDSLNDLFGNSQVSVVYVSSTNQYHHPQVLAAAAAGRHILCEKPLAMRLEDAVEMVRVCRERGVLLATNHHLRNAVTIRALRELVADGAIGEVRSALASQPVHIPADEWRRANPAAGAGVSYDVLVHTADAVRFILGQEPMEVCALGRSGPTMANGINDSVMATYRFKSGALAQVYADFNTPQARTRVEVLGSEGSAVGIDVLSKTSEHRGRVTLRRGGGEEEIALESDASRYLRAIDCFNAAVHGQGEPACTGIDGVRSLAMVLAAEEAARTGRTVAVKDAGLEFR
jgi:1,5-anhydro-D-fructose reductase (1,5-anhydro-D-mannitol-forming)